MNSSHLLKKLYQQLFPKSVRHDLGEYYASDWLAEHVLAELGYSGKPDSRLLDPTSGSGTFLVMAINRVKRWYDEHREQCGFEESDLCRELLANVSRKGNRKFDLIHMTDEIANRYQVIGSGRHHRQGFRSKPTHPEQGTWANLPVPVKRSPYSVGVTIASRRTS